MDDVPIGGGGGGGYKVDWDAIDENTNPFEMRSKLSTFSQSPKVQSKVLDKSGSKENNSANSPANMTKMEEKKKIETSMQENFEKLKRLSKTHTNSDEMDDVNQRQMDSDSCESQTKTVKPVNSQISAINKNRSDSDSDVDSSPSNVVVNLSKPNTNTPPGADHTQPTAFPRESPANSQPSSAPKDVSPPKPPSTGVNTPVQIKNLSPEAQLEILRLRKENDNYKSTVGDMKRCIVEFERTLQQIMDEKQRAQVLTDATINELTAERDQAMQDLSTVEKAFGDLHRRFEKSKAIIDSFKSNEETLKQCIEKSKQKLNLQEEKYQTLKEKAEEKLKVAHEEIDTLKRSKEAEVIKLQAALKRSELQVNSIESQLQQKIAENKELTKICDELISKCGT